jgi:hypothetical protein
MVRFGTLFTKSPSVLMVSSVMHKPWRRRGREWVSARKVSRLSFTSAWGQSGEKESERPAGVA